MWSITFDRVLLTITCHPDYLWMEKLLLKLWQSMNMSLRDVKWKKLLLYLQGEV